MERLLIGSSHLEYIFMFLQGPYSTLQERAHRGAGKIKDLFYLKREGIG